MACRQTNLWQQVTRDVVTALGVLALVFLSFGHQPIAWARDSAVFVYANGDLASFCGGAPEGGRASGKGCDACRLASGIGLPPAPCLPAARFAMAVRSVDLDVQGFVPDGVLNRVQDPRAPPFV